ncbi:hypothetical protein EIQ23_11340 [Xanthomonas campestris pv. campestris]
MNEFSAGQSCIAQPSAPLAACRLPLAACRFAFALACSFSGAPYRSGKADRYNPQGGAHGCATFL